MSFDRGADGGLRTFPTFDDDVLHAGGGLDDFLAGIGLLQFFNDGCELSLLRLGRRLQGSGFAFACGRLKLVDLRLITFECLGFVAHANNGHRLHGDLVVGTITRAARRVRDRIRHVLPFDDAAENTMPVVQMRRRRHGDEELAAIGAGTRVGHRKHAGSVVLERRFKLVGELVAGAATTGAFGIAGLDHEAGNDAVENDPVIELRALRLVRILRALGQADEVGDRQGRLFELEPGDDFALGGFDFRVQAIRAIRRGGHRAGGRDGRDAREKFLCYGHTGGN